MKDKNYELMAYMFEERKKYLDLIKFINNDSLDVIINIQKETLGFDGVFKQKRKLKLDVSTLTDILYGLVHNLENSIDNYIFPEGEKDDKNNK